jgi:hypothetical protein
VVNVIRLLDVVKFPSVSTDSDVKDRVLSTKKAKDLKISITMLGLLYKNQFCERKKDICSSKNSCPGTRKPH